MITPIKAMTISQIIERQDDLVVSTNDIKELAKNERVKTIDKLENKLKIWDHGVNAIPNYVWKSVKEAKGGTE